MNTKTLLTLTLLALAAPNYTYAQPLPEAEEAAAQIHAEAQAGKWDTKKRELIHQSKVRGRSNIVDANPISIVSIDPDKPITVVPLIDWTNSSLRLASFRHRAEKTHAELVNEGNTEYLDLFEDEVARHEQAVKNSEHIELVNYKVKKEAPKRAHQIQKDIAEGGLKILETHLIMNSMHGQFQSIRRRSRIISDWAYATSDVYDAFPKNHMFGEKADCDGAHKDLMTALDAWAEYKSLIVLFIKTPSARDHNWKTMHPDTERDIKSFRLYKKGIEEARLCEQTYPKDMLVVNKILSELNALEPILRRTALKEQQDKEAAKIEKYLSDNSEN